MKFTAVAGALLFANLALAGPRAGLPRASRRNRPGKRSTTRSSLPKIASENLEAVTVNGTVEVEYSSNWAGAVLIGSGYTSVAGTITVPTPSVPSGSSSGHGKGSSTEYSASAWVGIDGDTCSSAILQTGVDFYAEGSQTTFDAWYEWYPDYAYYFSGIDISAGDVVTMTVEAYSTSSGIAVIENETTGTTVSYTFSDVTGTLCETNAEWIVEDFEECTGNSCSLVPLADFGTVTFTSCELNGADADLDSATIIDIEQSSTILTDCSASSDTVTCTYL